MYRPLTVKLNRRGHKKYSVFNVVVTSGETDRKGGFIEVIGFVNPQYTERQIYIDSQRLAIWLNRGAQVHPSVAKYIYLAATSFHTYNKNKNKNKILKLI